MLRELQAEMEDRYRELLARGLRKVRREDALPLHLVVCDELAFYSDAAGEASSDRSSPSCCATWWRAVVRRGSSWSRRRRSRARDVVPTALRDLFGFRLAMRCNTPQASDTILGQGWASAGADASTIPGGQRGVGYLLAEGERPERIKGFHLCDDDVRAISERASRAARGRLARRRARPIREGWAHDRRRRRICEVELGHGARPGARARGRPGDSGSGSSVSCARPATAGGRCGCAARPTRSTSRPARCGRCSRPRREPDRDAAEVLRQSARGGVPELRGGLPR